MGSRCEWQRSSLCQLHTFLVSLENVAELSFLGGNISPGYVITPKHISCYCIWKKCIIISFY